MFISEQVKDERITNVLARIRSLRDRRDEEVKALKEQIKAVEVKCRENSKPDEAELQTLIEQAVLQVHGLKAGDVVECRYGWRKRTTRKYRIDAVIAEPDFIRMRKEEGWPGDVDKNVCDFELIGTCIRADGKDGETSVRISIGTILSRDVAEAEEIGGKE